MRKQLGRQSVPVDHALGDRGAAAVLLVPPDAHADGVADVADVPNGRRARAGFTFPAQNRRALTNVRWPARRDCMPIHLLGVKWYGMTRDVSHPDPEHLLPRPSRTMTN